MMTPLSLHSRNATAGQMVHAYEPAVIDFGYETGDPFTGCYYWKCANGYAFWVSNDRCTKGHCNNNTFASGYPMCPHGDTQITSYYRYAHCSSDSGWRTPGYRAPCGRTTTKTPDDYGYVTRTRTTSYTEETVPGEHAYKEVSRGRTILPLDTVCT